MKIKLSKSPHELKGWTVEYHNGSTLFDPESLSLHLEAEQEKGYIKGDILAERLKEKSLNTNAMEYLLKNPKLIPEEWKDKAVFFWGTIYRNSDGNLSVRCLCWDGRGWGWLARWLDFGWDSYDPAAVPSSPQKSESQNSSGAQTLELAIAEVKKAGYVIYKKV